MKHALRLLGCVLLALFLCLPTPVYAQTDFPEALEQTIIDSCIYSKRIEISEYDLTEQELETLFYALKGSGQLPWYTTWAYHYSYEETTGKAVEFEAEPLDETAYDRTLYEQKVTEVLDTCIYDGMSQLEIALSIHDYLVLNTAYDTTETRNSGYDLLVNGTTMCAGYAEAYQDLLLRAGIPCLYVSSDSMEHAWNLVCIDGQWYHVDVTWDDPSPDQYGFVSHEYFLLTDQEIAAMEEPHHGWETETACTDTRFSDAFWRDLYGSICFTDSRTCYLIRTDDFQNRICARDTDSDKESTLFREKEMYVDIGYGDYTYSHQGLSYWCGRLYFSSLDEVFSINPDGKDRRSEYRYDAEGNDKFIYSCYVNEDTLFLCLADHNGNTTSQTIALTAADRHIHSYTQTVQAPTCLEPGFTVSVCDCGLTCQSDPTAATGHNYQQTAIQKATIFSDGFWTETCTGCADVVTHHLPKTNPVLLLSASIPVIWLILAGVVGLLCAIFSKAKKKTKV